MDFYHVYSDLMTLVKSQTQQVCAGYEYALFNFLQEVKMHPERLMDKSIPVFISESRLYTDNVINDSVKNEHVYNELFTFQNTDEELLLPRIKVATESMTTKLIDYMKDQLPGGKY